MKTFKNYLLEEEQANETPSVGDVFELEMARDETLIETTVVEVLEDGIVINADDTVIKMFEDAGYLQEYWTGMDSVALGGNKSPVGSRSPKKPKFTEQQIQEGKMKELLGDINELTHDEFSGKYNMSKDEAREKFDIKDEEELDEMSAMRRLAGMMQDKENIKNTRIPSHDERRIQVDLIDLSDEEFEAKHKMSKAQAREQFDEDMDEMSEPTQDAFKELKDYAETSGGIDKEEFEKAAYLVKAMGKPHLKDKAEGMLDDLIGNLTFLKNLFKTAEVDLDEAEYQGRKVKLGKPTRGDVKKFKVYVKNPKGNVVKVNFGHGGTSAKKAGQKTMKIKKSNPARRKSFRARHNCDNPGPRHKARYWSCRAW